MVDAEAAFGDAQVRARREHEVLPGPVGRSRRLPRSVLCVVAACWILFFLASSSSHPEKIQSLGFVLENACARYTLTTPRPSSRLIRLHYIASRVQMISRTNTSALERRSYSGCENLTPAPHATFSSNPLRAEVPMSGGMFRLEGERLRYDDRIEHITHITRIS